MKEANIIIEECQKEITFKTSRSSGPGGQNVNKVESKVTLLWDIKQSTGISEVQREKLLLALESKINQEGVMVLYHQKERSQLANKEKVILKWQKLIREAFVIEKKRKPTRPPKSSLIQGRKEKTNRSIIKGLRQKPRIDDL